MMPENEAEFSAEEMDILEGLEAASDFAIFRAQMKQHIKSYFEKELRWQARRQAEDQRFVEARKGIRRSREGWSPISDRELAARSPDERERARKARNKRDERAKKRKAAEPAPSTVPAAITREGFTVGLTRLKAWLTLPDHRQRHHRGREAEIMRSWVVYRDYLTQHGRKPSSGKFAGAFKTRFGLPMTVSMARNRLKLLGTLMAAGGPLR